MDRTQCRIAVTNGGHKDSDAGQVVNIVEVAAPTHHFLVNGIELLRATTDLGLDLCLAEVLVHSINNSLHVCVALGRAVLDQ